MGKILNYVKLYNITKFIKTISVTLMGKKPKIYSPRI